MKATRIIKSKNLNKGKYEQLEEQADNEWLVECKKEFELIVDAHENPPVNYALEYDDGRGLVAIKHRDLGVLTWE